MLNLTREQVLEKIWELTKTDSTQFEYIKIRRNKNHIIKDIIDGNYIRFWYSKAIHDELLVHKKLLSFGFPVAKILSTGNYQEFSWYKEENLWDEPFAKKFILYKDNPEKTSKILKKLLIVTKKYFTAQKHTICNNISTWDVFKWYHVNNFIKELEDCNNPFLPTVKKIKNKLEKVLPTIPKEFTHWDFNCFNIFDKWIIDFEDSFYWPIGWDAMVTFAHTLLFPRSWAENISEYAITKEMFEWIEKAFHSNFEENFWVTFILKCFWWNHKESDRPLLHKYRMPIFEKFWRAFLEDKNLYKLFREEFNLN